MAIARTTRPNVIVIGTVRRVTSKTRKADGLPYANEVTLDQEHGAAVAVQVYLREPAIPLPQIGDEWAVVASVEESAQYGAALTYEESAENLLDRLAVRA